MDDNYQYAVYDEVNDKIKIVPNNKVDELDVNTTWTMQTINGNKYLYNLGAKKYATCNQDGSLVLATAPTNIEVTDKENGISINGNNVQWAFVRNDNFSAPDDLEENITGIETLNGSSSAASVLYSLDGRKTTANNNGLIIMRRANGTTRKIAK